MTDRFDRFHLVGADTLLIECARLLLERGLTITGVASDAPRIRRFCEEAGLHRTPVAGLEAALAAAAPDYLLSITHLQLLPPAVLRLPKVATVNFHDGPLPRHAGLNAPVWALLDREARYGISWHRVVEEVDAGDLLRQVEFELEPGETSLSLNTKNFRAALESFGGLVEDLVAGRVAGRPQDPAGRTVHRRDDRPAGAGVLDFGRPAVELDAMVRALDFGPYPNPVGAAKILHGGRVVGVTGAELVEGEAGGEPGEILRIGDRGVWIGTGDGVLSIRGVAGIDGRDLELRDWAADWGLREGRRLDLHEAGLLEQIRLRAERAGPAERRWLRALAELEPVALPAGAGADPAEIELPAALRTRDPARLEAVVVAALGAVLARATGLGRVAVGVDAVLPEPGLRPLFHGRDFVVCDLGGGPSGDELVAAVGAELGRVRAQLPPPRDLVLRQPDLRRGVQGLPVVGLRVAAAEGEGLEPVVFELDPAAGRLRLAAGGPAWLAGGLAAVLDGLAADGGRPVLSLPLVDAATAARLVAVGTGPAVELPDSLVHREIERMVDLRPDAVAVVCEGSELSFAALDAQANRLAQHLIALGLRPGDRVGIHVPRGLEMLVAALAAMKAGGCYVPLDPDYPAERIAELLADARPALVIGRGRPLEGVRFVDLDREAEAIAARPAGRPAAAVGGADLAYLIYTSGSTGRPKGVMVEHRHVMAFFAGMDGRIPHAEGQVLLAVTSLSFDISVLELFWTLSRGMQVVMYRDPARLQGPATRLPERGLDFGLFYFSSDATEAAGQRYRLLLEGARFGDAHGFSSVWTPERHFHDFGGLYPNPAVTSAAVAAITERIAIRAGSVVLPLHHPIRVAEAWAVVDNLSNGRVGMSVAAGWQPNDFVLRPDSYRDAKAVMFRELELVQRLWRGETVEFPGHDGVAVPIRTLPRPIQPELPVWVTTAGNPETYRQAGAIGANVLTHLLGQSVEQLAPKIQAYREARAQAGFDPATGVVSLMLHTFVGTNEHEVRELVREPLKAYLGSSLQLVKHYAWAFPAFKRPGDVEGDKGDDLERISPEEQDALLEQAFLRYYETSGLFGTVEDCVETADRLKAIGVDEIACLIDFGVPTQQVLDALPLLDEVRQASNRKPALGEDPARFSLPELIRRHRVTHLQCTPSMGRMLLVDPEFRGAVSRVGHLLLGGEALTGDLVRELRAVSDARLWNMYGPTETTVWSAVAAVGEVEGVAPLGEPIANTTLLILDQGGQLLPDGLAGELWIGGAAVTRGYSGREELTAERFRTIAFEGLGFRQRMYRTGDVVRRAADGRLEFLGRGDHQVKIRGHRIELGEIESRIGDLDGVREAVVVARPDGSGTLALCAFYAGAGAPEEGAVRGYLRDELPDFMVPSHIVRLDQLPRTPNGKLDRNALPAGPAAAAAEAGEAEEPRDDLQRQIAAIWARHLGLNRVGPNDNFFDIGGHSLLVVRVHRELRETLAPDLGLTDLYRLPTVARLAAHIASGGGEAAASVEQANERAERRREALGRRRRGRMA
jgi:natural product biosynthesis luciferase-like monooxygenase protein